MKTRLKTIIFVILISPFCLGTISSPSFAQGKKKYANNLEMLEKGIKAAYDNHQNAKKEYSEAVAWFKRSDQTADQLNKNSLKRRFFREIHRTIKECTRAENRAYKRHEKLLHYKYKLYRE